MKIDRDNYWNRAVRVMVETTSSRRKRDQPAVMWAMLREAAQVSRSWPAPPRQDYPSKSAMPEAPDEVTEWQRARFAFEEGITVTQMYGTRPRPQWTAEQHSHAEYTLHLFHSAALVSTGDRKRLRAAVWAYALGIPTRKIRAFSGLNSLQLNRAKDRACEDMLAAHKADMAA